MRINYNFSPSIAFVDDRVALATTKEFPGVSGRITIDKDRNAQKAIVVLRIQDGQFRFVESIEP